MRYLYMDNSSNESNDLCSLYPCVDSANTSITICSCLITFKLVPENMNYIVRHLIALAFFVLRQLQDMDMFDFLQQ
jgi:hypothetical protein